MEHYLKCIGCGTQHSPEKMLYACPYCGDLLDVRYDYEGIRHELKLEDWSGRPLGVWRYSELLPVTDIGQAVSLGEGGTTLHRVKRLAERYGITTLHVKNEGGNPTGSFKDRGMTVGISRALELGAKTVACASTGNTSASMAAYAAKAGLKSIILIPSGKVALGKLAQAIIHGATILQVRGSFDQCLKIILQLARSSPEIYLLNSVNPYRLEGQKTIAFEIWDQLGGKAPDVVVVPVGNAGNISAIWKGFTELKALGLLDSLPRMVGVQASGASPIAKAFKDGHERIRPIPNPQTLATAIRIGSPANWKKALRAARESGGLMETVTDREIFKAQRELACLEGIFVEPASASSLAGLCKLLRSGRVHNDEAAVCVATGHGLKDVETVLRPGVKLKSVAPSLEAVIKALGST